MARSLSERRPEMMSPLHTGRGRLPLLDPLQECTVDHGVQTGPGVRQHCSPFLFQIVLQCEDESFTDHLQRAVRKVEVNQIISTQYATNWHKPG